MMSSGVIFNVKDNIGIVQMNNPNRANALSSFLIKNLQEQVRILAKNDHLHAVIFTAGKSHSFSSGADLKERQEMDEADILSYVSVLRETFNEIALLPMPTIAAIKGLALGGGCELSLACDIRVMEESAVIGLTEVSWGIIPGAGGTQRLQQLVGIGMAKKLIFTAEKLNSCDALKCGLVEEICSDGEAEMKAFQISKKISENSARSVRLAKKAINGLLESNLLSGLQKEWDFYQKTIPHPDRLEGLAAFREKRSPNYSRTMKF